jgi:hypothetical protein
MARRVAGLLHAKPSTQSRHVNRMECQSRQIIRFTDRDIVSVKHRSPEMNRSGGRPQGNSEDWKIGPPDWAHNWPLMVPNSGPESLVLSRTLAKAPQWRAFPSCLRIVWCDRNGWLTTQSTVNQSWPQFPGNRELTGKIATFREAKRAFCGRNSRFLRLLACSGKFPEQGIYWAITGNHPLDISELSKFQPMAFRSTTPALNREIRPLAGDPRRPRALLQQGAS